MKERTIMKKSIALLLSIMLVISMTAGCYVEGRVVTPTSTPAATPASTPATTPTSTPAVTSTPDVDDEVVDAEDPDSRSEIRYDEETGLPVVFMTTEITPESLIAIYNALGAEPAGNIAIKIHTGETLRSNHLRPELIGDLVRLIGGTLVETNTAGGQRARSATHMQIVKDHGFLDLAPFDLLDADGEISLPINVGEVLSEVLVGVNVPNYDYYVVLSHFKGHASAGYGGAIKNIAIGLASAPGKSLIHSGGTRRTGYTGSNQERFLKGMSEAMAGIVDHIGEENFLYINVMNRLSVDCDCMPNPAQPDMHDIGILASFDPVALDQACIDLVYAASDGASLIRRIEARSGLITLTHSEDIGLGSREYVLVSLDD